MDTHGAGYAVRSIVICIIMPQQVKSFLRQRITMEIVAKRHQDSSKKNTVLEGIILIVRSAGDLNPFYTDYSNGRGRSNGSPMFTMP